MITYSPTVPAYLKSVKTVDDVEVGGTLTCDKLIVTDDTRTNEGDLVIQQGDLILYESPAIPDPGERVDERKIVFNLGDSGLDGATCEIGMKGGTNGVQGDIIFRCQTGVEVPGSTLEEVARFRGADLGIGTSIPAARLDVAGDMRCLLARMGLVSDVGDYCPLALNSKGRTSTDGGQFFFEPGQGSNGSFDGLSAFNVNCYQGPVGVVYPNPSKLGWRYAVDERPGADMLWLDSLSSGSTAGISRRWLECNGLLGTTTLGEGLVIDKLDGGTNNVRPTVDNASDLGNANARWKQLFAGTSTIATSDVTKKRDVVPLPKSRGLSFIEALQPKKYRFIEEESDSGRYHWGLIAQDVESLLSSLGDTDGLGNGLVCKTVADVPNPDYEEGGEEPETISSTSYGLRYTELIPCLIKAVQELSAKNTALEARIEALE